MNIYRKKQRWKLLLLIGAFIIGMGSIWYTNLLVERLSYEEKKKVELWAEATRLLATADISEQNFGFLLQVIQNNRTVPVILVNGDDEIVSYRNLDSIKSENQYYLEKQLTIMKEENLPIVIDLIGDEKNYIYYKDSTLLTQLTHYPLIQLGVILLFILVSYLAFSSSRKAEQNQVWLGLSKETAHQLGTPTSSLIAWVELLKAKNIDEDIVSELEKDVLRLEKITERFSKVGSKPVLKPVPIFDVVNRTVEYLRSRVSEKVTLNIDAANKDLLVPLNPSLFEWVIENVCKNALDAIEGKGIVTLKIKENTHHVHVNITDNGKGIPKGRLKTIFKPGFTTKQRGWGLGLSLSKRIIEEYHDGKIYVAQSELNVGTTIRITLKNN